MKAIQLKQNLANLRAQIERLKNAAPRDSDSEHGITYPISIHLPYCSNMHFPILLSQTESEDSEVEVIKDPPENTSSVIKLGKLTMSRIYLNFSL